MQKTVKLLLKLQLAYLTQQNLKSCTNKWLLTIKSSAAIVLDNSSIKNWQLSCIIIQKGTSKKTPILYAKHMWISCQSFGKKLESNLINLFFGQEVPNQHWSVPITVELVMISKSTLKVCDAKPRQAREHSSWNGRPSCNARLFHSLLFICTFSRSDISYWFSSIFKVVISYIEF